MTIVRMWHERGRRRTRDSLPWLVFATSLACSAQQAGSVKPAHPDASRVIAKKKAKKRAPKANVPFDILQRSARNFYGLERGNRLDAHRTWARLQSEQALCIGEQHDDPQHHYAQWRVISSLSSDSRARGLAFAAGFEAFQTPYQASLTAYANGRSNDRELLTATEYKKRWGYPFAFYRPMLRSVMREKGELLALNAPKELTRAVARHGLSKLTAEQRKQLPELELTDAEHRRFFVAAMSGHSHAARSKPVTKPPARTPKHQPAAKPAHAEKPSAVEKPTKAVHPSDAQASRTPAMSATLERFYAAQVTWDETMAETAARWVSENPGGRVVVIAGSGHCHQSAIPRRFERRTGLSMLSVRPLREEALGAATSPKDTQFDLLLVLEDRPPLWPPPPIPEG